MPSNIFRTARGGYTLLLAVLVASILLATALSVYQFGIKETRFAILQKNSQKAVAASSQGLECAVYWDRATEDMSGLEWTIFPTSTPYAYPPSLAPGVAKCGGTDIRYAVAAGWSETVARTPTSATTQFKLDTGNGSCATVTVKKSRENDDPDLQSVTEIQSEAFSDCSGKDPRRASRRLNFTIKGDGGPIAVIGSGSPVAQCDDTVDNDGDTFTDLADPGCADAADNDETDVVVNQLPVVNMTAPANNAVFTAGDDVTLSADATDADNGVNRVSFYRNGTLIGTDTTAPYSVTWTNVPAGAYSLVARAFDNNSPEASSDSAGAVNITVNPAPVTTRVDMASPSNYTAAAGDTISVTLNWYRVNDEPSYATSRFLKISDGTSHYSLNDAGVTPSAWATGAFQESVPVTLPNPLAPGTYDILTGLSGDPPDPFVFWEDILLEEGTNVDEVPYYPRHYKVGTVVVGTTNITYLSDLVPTNDPPPNGWGPYERDLSNGENVAGDGNPMAIDGATYAKGLGVHAYSELHYDVPAGCTNFEAYVGVDDEVDMFGQGSVNFIVYDSAWNNLYESGKREWWQAALPVNINVSGLSGVRLTVDNSGDNDNFDHADWADAKFTGCL